MINSLQNIRCLGSRVRVWYYSGHNDPSRVGYNDPLRGGHNNPSRGGHNNPSHGGHNDPSHPALGGHNDPRHVIVFLHGSGITAFGMMKWLQAFWRPPVHTAIGELRLTEMIDKKRWDLLQ